jgi:hypothetical protein
MGAPVDNDPRIGSPRSHAKKGWFERQPEAAKAAMITGICSVLVAVIAGVAGLATGFFGGMEQNPASANDKQSFGTFKTGAPSEQATEAEESSTTDPPSNGDGRGSNRTFNSGYYIDLDSSRQNWDLSSSEKSASDLGFPYLAIKALKIQGEATKASATPDIDACNNSTTRFSLNIEDEDFAAGNSFCVATTDKNWVWIKIVKFDLDSDPQNITLDIVPLGKITG